MTKKLGDNNFKHLNFLLLKISFLTLFGFGVIITPIINPINNLCNDYLHHLCYKLAFQWFGKPLCKLYD